MKLISLMGVLVLSFSMMGSALAHNHLALDTPRTEHVCEHQKSDTVALVEAKDAHSKAFVEHNDVHACDTEKHACGTDGCNHECTDEMCDEGCETCMTSKDHACKDDDCEKHCEKHAQKHDEHKSHMKHMQHTDHGQSK